MRILVFTTLYPNAAMPNHGVFVENRLRAFLKRHDAEVRVIAPVPWFPSQNETFGQNAKWARVPLRENRDGIEVYHPRYFIPPTLGMQFAPGALTRCLRKAVRTLEENNWHCDLIDAHYFYPDGVAAASVAKSIGKPLVITARGTDVNLLPDFAAPRRAIADAAKNANAIVAVASSLKEKITQLGIPEEKISVLRNGVDAEIFQPVEREAVRKRMGLSGRVIASVGRLTPHKGHDLVIEALSKLPDTTLLIAGEGEAKKDLEECAIEFGVENRVRFLGAIPHKLLKRIYSVSHALVLASSREGWPNVLLEAMACGTPCIAADVGGVSDVIRAPEAGMLLKDRSPDTIAATVQKLFDAPPCRNSTRAYAERHGWEETADALAALFKETVYKHNAAARIQRFPLAAPVKPAKPKLIVTIDTEESFDWAEFNRDKHNVPGTAGLAAFQNACAAEGVLPLYFLTYPIIRDQENADFFRTLMDKHEAACGIHFHGWTTPPYDSDGPYHSFQSNLRSDILIEKLRVLSSSYEAAFGHFPRAHRAGRYGVAPHVYHALGDIGVRYDFSPSPAFDFTHIHGPDFSATSNHPCLKADNDWRIAVTPVSGGLALRGTRHFLSQEQKRKRGLWPRGHVPMRLTPERASLADMKALTRKLLADQIPVLTLSLHSTSLSPGANPYAETSKDAERMVHKTQRYLQWFRKNVGGEITSLSGLTQFYDEAFTEPQG